MAAAPPVSPDPMGYSPNSTPGESVPSASTASPSGGQVDLSGVKPANFATTTVASAGDAIKNYKMGVLQATAAGGMAQQRDFNEAHQAVVDARTQALGQSAARAAAAGGGSGLVAAMQGRIDPAMGLRIGNSNQHQADFKAAASQRGQAFSNYMSEVNAAIPLAQAAAYGKAQAKQAATKQASLDSQYNSAVGQAKGLMDQDTAARGQVDTQLKGLDQQIANLKLQQGTNEQLLGEMSGAKGAGITGEGSDQGMKIGSALTSGATYDPNRFQRLNDANTKVKNQLSQLQSQRDQLDQGTPQPKGLSDYVQGVVGQSNNPALVGKAALGQSSLMSGQNNVAKLASGSSVNEIMSRIPGIQVADAQKIAADPTYGTMRTSAQKGLTMTLDDRGRVPGTQTTPWEAFTAALNSSGEDPATQMAIMKEFQPLYHAAGRDAQLTAKQQKARG